MKLFRGSRTRAWKMLPVLVAACALLVAGFATAQTQTPGPGKLQRQEPMVKGAELFAAYCSACHGPDARGNGPVASLLKTQPADLTVIARNNGGRFPAARVRRIIAGDDAVGAHGTRTMPIWGPIFRGVQSDQVPADVRLDNLVKYLATLQIN